MAFRKFTTLQLNNDSAKMVTRQASIEKTSKLSDFEFTPEPGFLYVTTRAISSRVNANKDGWPPSELRRAYRTFIGKPVFVDHNNWDLDRARGVVLDAKIHESKLASDYDETWIELLIEVDADAFPKLAQSIMDGDIDSVSMGADVDYTVCSVCDNVAHEPMQFCAHIPQMKGQLIETTDKIAGRKMKKLCYEDCYGVKFFELSFVFEPADESALISDSYLVPKVANRTLAHIRRPYEKIASYGERVGMVKTADVPMIALPEPVNTLRDEMDCPQCGAEWDGVVCQGCGFELPPEGLGDPTSGMAFQQDLLMRQFQQMLQSGMDPNAALQRMQAGGVSPQILMALLQNYQAQQQAAAQQQSAQAAPEQGAQGSSSEEKPKKKKKNKKKSGYEGGLRVSRYDSFVKEATLPQDPQYVQDTSTNPGTQVGPYGTVAPTVPQGFEQALEPAPAAPAQLQDLDAPDVQGPVGQSTVAVVAEQPGPSGELPPGTAVGEQVNVHAASAEEVVEEVAEETEEASRQPEFEKFADVVTWTDVRALDEPPAVDVGADATVNVLAPVLQPDQLALADTTDVINDGSETGLPTGPDFRARLQEQYNPFNDAALIPYQPVNPQVTASVEEIEEEDDAEARIEQRIAAAKTRVLRIANFVDERVEMGLVEPSQKFTEIARFEEMDDATLDGYIQATREAKASELRTASKRVRVASVQEENATVRMPSLGSAPKIASVEDVEDIADDYVAFL